MALIKCYECSKEISDLAMSCPNCGAPQSLDSIKNNKSNNLKNYRSNTNIYSFWDILTKIFIIIAGKGRLGRKKYLKYITLFSIVLSFFFYCSLYLTSSTVSDNSLFIFIVPLSSFVFSILFLFPLTIKRLHDVNISASTYFIDLFLITCYYFSKDEIHSFNILEWIAGFCMITLIISVSRRSYKKPNRFGDRENETYMGEWLDGRKNGIGAYYFEDGNKYVGEFQNDVFHGNGIYYYSDGNIKSGEWNDGEYIQ